LTCVSSAVSRLSLWSERDLFIQEVSIQLDYHLLVKVGFFHPPRTADESLPDEEEEPKASHELRSSLLLSSSCFGSNYHHRGSPSLCLPSSKTPRSLSASLWIPKGELDREKAKGRQGGKGEVGELSPRRFPSKSFLLVAFLPLLVLSRRIGSPCMSLGR